MPLEVHTCTGQIFRPKCFFPGSGIFGLFEQEICSSLMLPHSNPCCQLQVMQSVSNQDNCRLPGHVWEVEVLYGSECRARRAYDDQLGFLILQPVPACREPNPSGFRRVLLPLAPSDSMCTSFSVPSSFLSSSLRSPAHLLSHGSSWWFLGSCSSFLYPVPASEIESPPKSSSPLEGDLVSEAPIEELALFLHTLPGIAALSRSCRRIIWLCAGSSARACCLF